MSKEARADLAVSTRSFKNVPKPEQFTIKITVSIDYKMVRKSRKVSSEVISCTIYGIHGMAV